MERQQKAYKGVIDYFKKKIMDGELRPGEKLPPERDIAERLNVSRNSVREAIRIMDMTGVISSQQGSGNYITCEFQKSLAETMTMMFAMDQIDYKQISQIRQAQPDAIIYLQSILVVSSAKDDPSGSINNATINARNQALEALANPQDKIFYLNVNEAVMDSSGCLDASLTSDGIHLLGNSLSLWEDYLKQHAIVPGSAAAASTTAPTSYTTAVTSAS